MVTKVLDAKVTINGKSYNVINTSTDIWIDWDIELQKSNASVSIKVQVNSVKGSFEYSDVKETYKKSTNISFSSNETWKITTIIKDINDILLMPLIAKIDLDTKTTQIYF